MGVTIFGWIPSRHVLLRGFARFEKIPDRYKIGDLQIWDPEFKVPADIQEELLENLRNKPLIGVLVIKHSDGTIECFTDPNLKEFSMDGEIQLTAHKNSYWKLVFAMQRCVLKRLLYSLSMETSVHIILKK